MMNKKIMSTLAIAFCLLNSGFSVAATDSDTKPANLQDKVEVARIAFEEAKKKKVAAKYRYEIINKIRKYGCVAIGLLAGAGFIAPLSRTLPHMYHFISAKDGIDKFERKDSLMVGCTIQMSAVYSILFMKILSDWVEKYADEMYEKACKVKRDAYRKYKIANREWLDINGDYDE